MVLNVYQALLREAYGGKLRGLGVIATFVLLGELNVWSYIAIAEFLPVPLVLRTTFMDKQFWEIIHPE